MASAWVERRKTSQGAVRYRVQYRLGGRESLKRYAGTFRTMREARTRRDWVAGELAALRPPDLTALVEPARSAPLRDVVPRWQASRVDVRPATTIQHRTPLNQSGPAGAR
jgi:hypothetical protein